MSAAPIFAPYIEPVVTDDEYAKIVREIFGRELKSLRKSTTDFNQEDMADQLGWAPSQVGAVERGKTPNIDLYFVYMRKLNASYTGLGAAVELGLKLAEARQGVAPSDEDD